MKNRMFYLLLLIFVCILGFNISACKKETENPDEIIEEVNTWINENYKEGIAESINLPTTYPNNNDVKISWGSNDPFLIDNTGKIIERNKKATKVIFDYVISYGGTNKEFQKEFTVSSIDLETAEERFLSQFPKQFFEDFTFKTEYDTIIHVNWESSNQAAFNNDGKYTKLESDSETTITYHITDGNTTITNEITLTVRGKDANDFFEEAKEKLVSEIFTERYITEDLTLPDKVNDKVTLTWKSWNEDIISNTGKVTKTLFERYVKLTAYLEIEEHTAKYDFNCIVQAKDTTNMTDLEKINEILSLVATKETKRINFTLYGNINQSYGFLYLYTNTDPTIVENLIPESNSNRPGQTKKSIEYICIHDTANNSKGANAYQHSVYLAEGGDGTSWHYSVDEEGAYHSIPDSETAYHAGDGSRYYALVDTKIKATSKLPNVTLIDGYLAINGIKTSERPYANADGTSYNSTNYETGDINELGIMIQIGENGNYYLGKTYYNTTYKLIANFGGNKNSIGIESCVNNGSDYPTTVRNYVKLVAWLCMENDLSVDRVQGHHYFSGKPCPNAILSANYWYEFKNLIQLEKYARTVLKDYDFTWKSNSENLLTSGKILNAVNSGDILSYSVTVTNKNTSQTVLEKNFETIVK